MKRILLLCITMSVILTIFSACKSEKKEKPEVLKENEITTMTNDVAIENTETSIDFKESNMSDKTVEMETITLVDENLYRDAYYGVPVKIGDKYYKIPALKVLNYYFLSIDDIAKITNLEFSVTESSITITSPEKTTIDVSSIEEGSIRAEAINKDDVFLLADEEKLALRYKNQDYISLITLEEYMNEEKFYIDRSIGAITNNKPNIEYPNLNENGLLRKNITLSDEKELVVRDGLLGKMLVIYDVYGSSVDITPNDISFATDIQNIFLHKTEDKIYMFGLSAKSTEVYTINIDESYRITIQQVGSIQQPSQNIYYINDTYVAIGRKHIFGINIKEDSIGEINLKTVVNMKELGGDFNIINGEYYVPIKDQFGTIKVYKLNIEEFKLDLVKELEIPIEINEVKENYYYSFVEDNKVSIYLMDNVGYIYNVSYDVVTDETTILQTDTFRLFYDESKFPVEFAINLVKQTEVGDSQLSLIVNNKYLGNNVVVFGMEDNWVYCSEYIEENGKYSLYSFRYNGITGIRDYSNLA